MKRKLAYLICALLAAGILSACGKNYVHVGPNWEAVHTLDSGKNSFAVDVYGPSSAKVGELLKFSVMSAKTGALWVYQVDSNDQVSQLYPPEGARPFWIEKRELVTVPPPEVGSGFRAAEPRGPITIAFIVAEPNSDLFQQLTEKGISIDKALHLQPSRSAWSVEHRVVEVK